jgi:hypothetical protein
MPGLDDSDIRHQAAHISEYLTGELTDKFIHVTQGDFLHLLPAQIADRMGKHYERMSVHALCAERMDCRVPENLGEKHRGGYTPLFEFNRVVHTAQRAGASSAYGCRRNLHPFGKGVDLLRAGRLRKRFFALYDDFFYTVTLAQCLRHGFENDVALFLGVVQEADDLPDEIDGAHCERQFFRIAACRRIDKPQFISHCAVPLLSECSLGPKSQ